MQIQHESEGINGEKWPEFGRADSHVTIGLNAQARVVCQTGCNVEAWLFMQHRAYLGISACTTDCMAKIKALL